MEVGLLSKRKKKQTARLDNTQFGLVYPHIKYL